MCVGESFKPLTFHLSSTESAELPARAGVFHKAVPLEEVEQVL